MFESLLVAVVILAACACRLCCYNVLTSALFKTSKHASSILRNFETFPSKFRESSRIVVRIFAGTFTYNFEISKDNSAFENSSKVRRYFVSFQKSLVFVEKWRNVSKFVEIRSHYFCTVLVANF